MTSPVTCSNLEILLLWAAQDAGLPQCDCDCPNCQAESPVCIAMIDHQAQGTRLVDATPAFAVQFDRLRRSAADCPPAGDFSHARAHRALYRPDVPGA